MSGYNKVLSLYEPDSDEDSSMGGSGILGQGLAQDSGSDDFRLPDRVMEDFEEDEYDEEAHLRPSVYNPANLTIQAGTAVNIDGDSDDDGASVGDVFSPVSRLKTSGDIDEHSIGSDDEFVPATKLENRITHHWENELTAHVGEGEEEGKEEEGKEEEGKEEEARGRGRGRIGRHGIGGGRAGGGRGRPQMEVAEALGRIRDGKTAGQLRGRSVGRTRADVNREREEAIRQFEDTTVKKDATVAELKEKAEQKKKAERTEKVKGFQKARAVKALAKNRQERITAREKLVHEQMLLRAKQEGRPAPMLEDAKAVLARAGEGAEDETDPKMPTGAGFSVPTGQVAIIPRGEKYSTITLNGVELAGKSNWKTMFRILQEIKDGFPPEETVQIRKMLSQRINSYSTSAERSSYARELGK